MSLPGHFPFLFPITDDVTGVGADAYARLLKDLLPPGHAFNLDLDGGVDGMLDSMAVELSRVDGRGVDLIGETDPRTAVETLPEWQAMLSLPDDRVTEIPADLPTRQLVVTQKFVSRGGQNYDFFARLVGSCGYSLDSITLFADKILRVGFRVNDRCYDKIYAYTMQLNITAPTGTAVDHPTLERIVRHRVHAHIFAIFVYL